MTLRTRRRISPRTKRRYRAIRNFFRRTLGSIASQPNIKINSSIAVNVTDLKYKLAGIENQLHEVYKHCHDIVSLENISNNEIETFIPTEGNDVNRPIIQKCSGSDKKLAAKDTELLYQNSEIHSIKAEKNDSVNYLYNELRNLNRHSSDTMNHDKHYANDFVHKTKSKKSRRDIYDDKFEIIHGNSRKNRTQPDLEKPVLYDSCSSLAVPVPVPPPSPAPARSSHRRIRRPVCTEEYTRRPVQEAVKVKSHKEKVKRNNLESPTRLQDSTQGKSKKKNINPFDDDLDQDFIADLIERQYKPVKIFNARSDSSQASFPVCRDNEFAKPVDISFGSDMCSCGRGGCGGRDERGAGRRWAPAPPDGDGRSLCDARLHSSHRRTRTRTHYQFSDAYNDSNLYDVVPVKEKSSPKSRRKFVEDNLRYEHLEVPPSPRSNRPRLNLQAQNYDESDDSPRVKSKHSRRNRSPYRQRRPECHSFRSELSSDESARIKRTGIKPKTTKNAEIQEDMGTISTNTTLNTLNKTDSNNDKTDKALTEIKDILQNFLQEIKQEASTPQCDKSSEVIDKVDGNCCEGIQQNNPKVILSVLQNSEQNAFAGNGAGLCDAPAGTPAAAPVGPAPPCCYGVLPMPVCPGNCVKNVCFLGGPNYTQYQGSTNGYNESVTRHGTCNPKEINETDNLIREIHKYVAQNTDMNKTESLGNNQWRDFGKMNTTKLSSKGVDKSRSPSKHDAGVGTLLPKCYSKSCDALSSRAPLDLRSRSNASYSETVLETTGLDATLQSTSNCETPTTNEASDPDKGKKSKFIAVLRSFGLRKKSKKSKDAIEEENETKSATEVDEDLKHNPFRQNLTSYMMHTQEFFNRPPSPLPRHGRHPSPLRAYGYPSCDCQMNEGYDPYQQCMRAHASAPPYGKMCPEASAPQCPCPWPYDSRCSHNMQPQVPLCLKEVEVKSAGTQSERGLPFFRRLSPKKTVQARSSSCRPSKDDYQKAYGTETVPNKQGLFKWKNVQSKAAGKKFDFAPLPFSYNEQQNLVPGDKLRTALLKKLFYKRNPFSPRNIFVRTLIGTDRSTWAAPPAHVVQRPRMWY